MRRSLKVTPPGSVIRPCGWGRRWIYRNDRANWEHSVRSIRAERACRSRRARLLRRVGRLPRNKSFIIARQAWFVGTGRRGGLILARRITCGGAALLLGRHWRYQIQRGRRRRPALPVVQIPSLVQGWMLLEPPLASSWFAPLL